MRDDIRALPQTKLLRELFHYDPLNGDLHWKSIPKNFRRARVGDKVGTVGAHGYLMVGIRRQQYFAHRIIWKMVTGNEPPSFIDHIDGNKLNNAWENFRLVTNGQNIWNSKRRKDNKSGVKGVCIKRVGNWTRYAAYISTGGKQYKLGLFKTLDEAAAVRTMAAEKLHGEFMRTG